MARDVFGARGDVFRIAQFPAARGAYERAIERLNG